MDAHNQQGVDDPLLEGDGKGNFDDIGWNTAEVTATAVANATAASLENTLFRHIRGTDIDTRERG